MCQIILIMFFSNIVICVVGGGKIIWIVKEVLFDVFQCVVIMIYIDNNIQGICICIVEINQVLVVNIEVFFWFMFFLWELMCFYQNVFYFFWVRGIYWI